MTHLLYISSVNIYILVFCTYPDPVEQKRHKDIAHMSGKQLEVQACNLNSLPK